MLWLALAFLIIAIVAGLFGFGFIASAATQIALILFWVFLALLVFTLIIRLVRRV
ncbi:MAG: DUF1328 domain-containing protein [Chloroflexi bacterium]|nr:DUF1328 domain-containing protein [Chloroflexota bacterium]